MKYLLPLCLTVLTSCATTSRPLVSASSNNKDYKIDYLFEHDGCKVYRFYDFGKAVYFTNCKGDAIAMTDSTEVRNTIQLVKQ